MEITDLIVPDQVFAVLRAGDKPRLLLELSRRSASATGVPQQLIRDALEAREKLGSTGVGAGIAIPHAPIAELDRLFGLFVRLDRRIDYQAIDDQPVDLVFLLLVPSGLKDHLQALACISRRLRDPQVAASLRKAEDAAALYDALTGP
jgi:PTS system nitrogen regulatory IIA component